MSQTYLFATGPSKATNFSWERGYRNGKVTFVKRSSYNLESLTIFSLGMTPRFKSNYA